MYRDHEKIVGIEKDEAAKTASLSKSEDFINEVLDDLASMMKKRDKNEFKEKIEQRNRTTSCKLQFYNLSNDLQRSDRRSFRTNLRLQVHRTRGDKDQWWDSNPGYVQTEMILRQCLF
ncbi:hypothetical protein TNCV_4686421 [Trichonephila clavipes]|nr:hypothetical protein TNCV_4686421 [Trichonephila clavipes]